MGRATAIATLTLALGGCTLTGNGEWDAWEHAHRHPLGHATVDQASQVVENRDRWLGAPDLSADLLMTLTGPDELSILAEIVDDRPLQQSRPPRVQPAWWLQRVGCDGLEVIVGEGEGAFSVIAALGSAGIDPQIIQGERGDSVEVWPTPTGARVHVAVDLGARGLTMEDVEDSIRVRLHDTDGPGDWSVHEAAIR